MKYHHDHSSIRIYTYIKSLCCTPKTKMMSYVHYLSVKLRGKHHDDMWSSSESPPLRCRFHKHVLQLPSMFHDLSSNWRGRGQRPQAASGWSPPVVRPPGCPSLPAFWGKGPSSPPHSDPSTSGLAHHTVRSPHHINRPRLWDQAACIFNSSCYKYTPWWIHLLPLSQTPVLACLNQPSALTQSGLRRLL